MEWCKEILDPIKDFYAMRTKKLVEFVYLFIIPIVIGIIMFIVEVKLNPMRSVQIDDFFNDILNQLITVLALFISFSMAYLSIIISSNGTSINELKETYSEYYFLDKGFGKCTLYQVLTTDITYTIVIEIICLLFVFVQKFIMLLSSNLFIKIFIAIDTILFIHILLMMVIIIKNIYFSFWKNRQDKEQ